ncbi:MAG: small multi-drug export protein [Candidatus Aenigmatarchaeota archaeon]
MLAELANLGLSNELIVVLMAAIPVAELRVSIPTAIGIFQMPWQQAFFLSIIGNLIPIPFLLLFFESVANMISKNRKGKKFIDWLYSYGRKKTGTIEKYKHAGLIIFVAIPLPGTGAWTAALIAQLLGMKFKYAMIDIVLGVIGAGIIVTALVLMGWIGALIALATVAALAFISSPKRA